MLVCKSKILYVRASLAPLARQIRAHNGWLEFFKAKIEFDEIFAPHFYGARPFWKRVPSAGVPRKSNSGALGKLIADMSDSFVSTHPTHAFAGHGPRVSEVLQQHGVDSWCFSPIRELAESSDFSMLLVGCLNESPGFSTVHSAQNALGLSQRHLVRYLLRWDTEKDGMVHSTIAKESPGCSLSFDKFYPYYREDGNLIQGEWSGVPWIFIPSALKAFKVELGILEKEPRFVKCGRLLCPTCSFRLY